MSKTLTLTLEDVPEGVNVICSADPPTLLERALKKDETMTSAEVYMARILVDLANYMDPGLTTH